MNPTPKDTGGAVGAAVATLVVFCAVKLGLDMSSEESVAVTGALATIVAFALSYVRPS